jgi:Mrp family chromosome partitioning ATPase
MARMVQALKNLEARLPRRVTGVSPAVAPETKIAPLAAASPKSDEIPAAPVRPRRNDATPIAQVTAALETVTVDLARLQSAIDESPLAPSLHWRPSDTASPSFSAPIPAPIPTPLLAAEGWSEPAPASAAQATVPTITPRVAATSTRPPTASELIVRCTLSNAVRGQPLVQLGERLLRDSEQLASKSLVMVGVGPDSATHETLLYAATVLAEKRRGEVLLVDADLARQKLSEALEYGRESGLTELLRNDLVPRASCRPTAVAGLSFLPAGLLRHADLTAAGPRLDAICKQLAAEFSFVLIDGGRSDELAAAVLARLTEATYFVVQLGTVEMGAAQAALRDFRAAGARVLGCIAT